MKGILLAGGTAKRFRPATQVVSKNLLCVYDKLRGMNWRLRNSIELAERKAAGCPIQAENPLV